MSDISRIKTLIENMKFSEALQELDLIAVEKNDEEFTIGLDMIKVRWKQINKKSERGIVSDQDELLERNKITHSLFSFLNENF